MMSGARKREVAGAYDAMTGRIYDIRYAEEQEFKYELLIGLVAPAPYHLVLDLGCGTGLLLDKLGSTGVGLDISPRLLVTARARTGSSPVVNLILGDAERLPFRDSAFHVILSVTLIQDTPDPVMVLMEMRRVGREGSRMAVTALKKAFSLGQFKSLLEESGCTHLSFHGAEELKDWVAIMSS